MKHRAYLQKIKALFLSIGYPISDAEDLFMHLLQMTYSEIYMTDIQIDNDQIEQLNYLIERRLKGEPIAYIIGYKNFLEYTFKVTNDTLIPRPETEILVNEFIKQIIEQAQSDIKILEIGTGTGCIAISVLKELQKKGFNNIKSVAIDISQPALEIAKQNALHLGVSNKIEFIQHDIRNLPINDFNYVISNPPYIPSEDIYLLDTSVKYYEPYIALDGGIDGLDYYKEIARYISKLNQCIVALEFGLGQSSALSQIFNFANKITILKDLSDIERIMIFDKT